MVCFLAALIRHCAGACKGNYVPEMFVKLKVNVAKGMMFYLQPSSCLISGDFYSEMKELHV